MRIRGSSNARSTRPGSSPWPPPMAAGVITDLTSRRATERICSSPAARSLCPALQHGSVWRTWKAHQVACAGAPVVPHFQDERQISGPRYRTRHRSRSSQTHRRPRSSGMCLVRVGAVRRAVGLVPCAGPYRAPVTVSKDRIEERPRSHLLLMRNDALGSARMALPTLAAADTRHVPRKG